MYGFCLDISQWHVEMISSSFFWVIEIVELMIYEIIMVNWKFLYALMTSVVIEGDVLGVLAPSVVESGFLLRGVCRIK